MALTYGIGPTGPDYIISRACPVFWGAWRTTTAQLQQDGWQLSADQDIMGCRLRLAMKHPDRRMTAICVPIEDFRFIDRPFDRVPEFHVQYMAHDIHVERVMMTGFRPIDAYPQLRTIDMTTQSIDDFKIFATPLVRTEEIIVDPPTVMELLEQIKAMQSPEQREIRERSRKRDARAPYEAQRATTFHAQILSFKEAA